MAKAKDMTLTPDQYLDLIRGIADHLDDAQDRVDALRTARDLAIWAARDTHGKNLTHNQLGTAARIGDSAARKVLDSVEGTLARVGASGVPMNADEARAFTAEGALPKAFNALGINSADEIPTTDASATDSPDTDEG